MTTASNKMINTSSLGSVLPECSSNPEHADLELWSLVLLLTTRHMFLLWHVHLPRSHISLF